MTEILTLTWCLMSLMGEIVLQLQYLSLLSNGLTETLPNSWFSMREVGACLWKAMLHLASELS